jgi:hypothetical protein
MLSQLSKASMITLSRGSCRLSLRGDAEAVHFCSRMAERSLIGSEVMAHPFCDHDAPRALSICALAVVSVAELSDQRLPANAVGLKQ